MKKKKIIIAAAVLLVVFLIGGVVALFTDTDSAKNTFTVGNVTIDVEETAWDALPDTNGNNIKDAAENLVPGSTVTKDPKVTNKSTSNPAYV